MRNNRIPTSAKVANESVNGQPDTHYSLGVPGKPFSTETPSAFRPEREAAKRGARQGESNKIDELPPDLQKRQSIGAEDGLNPGNDWVRFLKSGRLVSAFQLSANDRTHP